MKQKIVAAFGIFWSFSLVEELGSKSADSAELPEEKKHMQGVYFKFLKGIIISMSHILVSHPDLFSARYGTYCRTGIFTQYYAHKCLFALPGHLLMDVILVHNATSISRPERANYSKSTT